MRSRSEAPHDLIVVGGGVIGLACARAAAQRGLDVLLLERDHEARGASWAAAGLVAPQHTVDGPDALFELLLASRALYPGFVEELGPHDTGWRTNGRLAVAPDVGEAERLRELVRWQRDRGLRAEWIEPAHVRDLEPAVTAELSGGAFFPDDADIDARRLLAALRAAAEASGVRVRTGVEVTEVTVTGGQVHGVASRGERFPADAVLLAAGAWSAPIAPGFRLPVRPLKGQMCAVAFSGLTRPVTLGFGPLVPRPDGRTLIGATKTDVGFDASLEPEAVDQLRNAAAAAVPEIAAGEVVETWIGFRPLLPDGLPAIGGTAVSGCFVATGHFTKGIALAPITAKLVAELIVDGARDPMLAPMDPGRFE